MGRGPRINNHGHERLKEKPDPGVRRLKLITDEAADSPDQPNKDGVGPEASRDIGSRDSVPRGGTNQNGRNKEVPDPEHGEWNDGQNAPDPGLNRVEPPELETDLRSEYPGAFHYDPYEGMEMLGIRRVPDPRAPPHGVLASREVTLFADDHIRNERHFYARNVTLATVTPFGDPIYFHGDATIRIDQPELNTIVRVPKRAKVNKAREYIFRKKENAPAEIPRMEHRARRREEMQSHGWS